MNWFNPTVEELTAKDTAFRRLLRDFVKDDSHIRYTPIPLCVEIADKLVQNTAFTSTTKVLVLANLEFLYVIKKLFEIKGYDLKRHVYFLAASDVKCNAAKMMIPATNVGKYNYEKLNLQVFGMKFDVIVGNPPYPAPGKENKAKLWPQFIDIAFGELVATNGFVSLITPKTWLTNGQWEKHFLSRQIIELNIDQCKKHFIDVHSSFSYFIVQNQSPTHSFRITNDESSSTLTAAPLSGMDLMYTGIVKKLISGHDYFQMITSSGYNTSGFSTAKKTLSRVKTDQHCHFVIHKISHTKGETTGFWSSELDRTTHGIPRVVVGLWLSDWKRERMLVGDGLLTCEQFRHFPAATVEQAEILKTVLSSKLYTYLLYSLVDGNSLKSMAAGSITNRAVSFFPKVDLTRSWTDAQLYTHFSLTREEIDLIEDTVK